MSVQILISKLEDVFTGPRPDDACTLHETDIIDSYGTHAERVSARQADTDRKWTEVQDQWIEDLGTIGLCHFNQSGLAYYLPCYLSWYLRKGQYGDNLAAEFLFYALERSSQWESVLSDQQKTVVREFLEFTRDHLGDRIAVKPLAMYWSKFSQS